MVLWIALISIYIIAENFCVALCLWWLLQRCQLPMRWPALAWLVWAILMSGLSVVQIINPPSWEPFLREYFYLPLAVQMVWNLLLLQVFFPVTLLVVIVVRIWSIGVRRYFSGMIRLRGIRSPRGPEPVPLREMEPAPISRRRFVYLIGCGAVPATAMGMGVYGGLNQFDLRVRKFTIPIVNLPPELEGFTIAHVSDLHSGLFVGPRRLKIITDTTNDLKADMIALTGDIINREMDEFPAALAAMKRMESSLGIFLCEGNHDVIPGEEMVMQECLKNQLPFLYNDCLVLPVRGQRLLLGGLSWDLTKFLNVRPKMVGELFPPRQASDVRILFAHHPHFFDIAQPADLVLSGHTHGGQIAIGDANLGKIRFKYCSGMFRRENTTLVVSNGAGDWFPCRIGAPAEVGLLKLTRA